MSSYGKSMFSNLAVATVNRPIYNPVSLGQGTAGGGGAGADDLALITSSYYNTLRIIEGFYGQNMANKEYYNIPNNYDQYVQYYVLLETIQSKIKNSTLALLIKYAQDTLIGAINSYTLYGNNIVLQLDKTNLQQQVQTILSNKNQQVVEVANTTGQLTITRSFTLAPVFNYYILFFGMPAFGVGFDPSKIAFLVDILNQNGINPYG
jgi:hypothetical protein